LLAPTGVDANENSPRFQEMGDEVPANEGNSSKNKEESSKKENLVQSSHQAGKGNPGSYRQVCGKGQKPATGEELDDHPL